jgi:hypothetical protein
MIYITIVVDQEVLEMKMKKGKKPPKRAKGLSHSESEKSRDEAVRTQVTLHPDDDNMDYGGIPPIDLKKNLGCG